MNRARPTVVLGAALFLSGASAIIFETLWFRQASLTFGNSVWATTLVLCSFMGGLALGNLLAGRYGARVVRPVRLYMGLELLIAGLGFALVVVLPALAGVLAPLFRPLLEQPWVLNPLRLLLALVLMLAPATAMGATLPFLVGALSASDPRFGAVLGKLYGWNTLGAVAGALGSEVFLVEAFGVRGAGLFAAGLNLTAAAIARFFPAASAPPRAAKPTSLPRRLLAAAFLCGMTLLALEVVWFRFLLLFLVNTGLALALLLSVILLGIGLGGFLGSALSRRKGLIAPLALLAGILVPTLYGALAWGGVPALSSAWLHILGLGLTLMLPVSLISGALFSLLGAAVHEQVGDATAATGMLTLANTTGSVLGAVLGGFVLLPMVGMEGAFFLLALAYGGVALCVVRRPVARVVAALGLLLAIRLAAFPFGLMEAEFLAAPVRLYANDGSRVVAVREGLTETILFLERQWLGQALNQRMVTNGFSMSGTHAVAKRYMKLFVYWPIAFRPDAKNALLISYGVGSTAKALTDTKALQHIDVVDISRDVLAMGPIVYPDPAAQPLRDPRVQVTVEDGRYFLLTTDRRYDLITAEPPPPKNAGIVNLYTAEYFALLRARLAEGGIATYWLPVHDLLEEDTKTITAAFCAAFDDCTLWNGSGLDLMLVGSRNAPPGTEAGFAQQWADPVAGPELRAMAFEGPEQLGATFLGDAAYLRELTRGTPPLTDDFPKRLREPGHGEVVRRANAFHSALVEPAPARARFEASPWVRRMWPEALRAPTLAAFQVQKVLNRRLLPDHFGQEFALDYDDLHNVLTKTPYRTLPLWLMQSTADEQRIAAAAVARGDRSPAALFHLAVGDLAARDFAAAVEKLQQVPMDATSDPRMLRLRAYALCLAGRRDQTTALRGALNDPKFWAWLDRTFAP